jgi:hypothetical protein
MIGMRGTLIAATLSSFIGMSPSAVSASALTLAPAPAPALRLAPAPASASGLTPVSAPVEMRYAAGGRHLPQTPADVRYALLRSVDVRRHSLTFDQLQWFWGAAAHRACVEDGETIGDFEWCHDYYYRNHSTYLRTLPVSRGASLTWLPPRDTRTPQKLTLTQLARVVAGKPSRYWVLTIRDGRVVALRQQFVP